MAPFCLQYRVTWSIRDSVLGLVKWGTKRYNLNLSVGSSVSTYTPTELCGSTAAGVGWSSPGSINTALITGLVPGKRYYYIVGSNEYGFSKASKEARGEGFRPCLEGDVNQVMSHSMPDNFESKQETVLDVDSRLPACTNPGDISDMTHTPML